MKIAGEQLGKIQKTLVLPLGDGDLVIKARPVLDYDECDTLNPRPEPKKMLKPGGVYVPDLKDKAYQEALDDWTQKRVAWTVIKSITQASEIEWDTVDFQNVETWSNWKSDFITAGLPENGCTRILNLVMEANMLNDEAIEDATASFLAGLGSQQES